MRRALLISLCLAMNALTAEKWVTVWTGSDQGPYPEGNPVAQPKLEMVLPGGRAQDQTFRMILKPDIWSSRVRVRFSNVLGSEPLRLDGIYVGVHASAGRLIRGTNRAVHFSDRSEVTIEPGRFIWSDPVELPYIVDARNYIARKMAVSFRVVGSSGPLTWHAKAMQTSYLSYRESVPHGMEESSDSFPFSTTSWFLVDAVDAMLPADTKAIVAFGDSITDGTNSTLNGDDRWPDFLSARVHDFFGATVAVVNAGIGGNQVTGPAKYDKNHPVSGGPSALERLDRDVLSLSGISAVIWLEGINDLGTAKTTAEAVIAGYKEGIARMHARNIHVTGATITSSLNSTATHGIAEVDNRRKAINDFIRHASAFDAFADFDAATLDAPRGTLRPEFRPDSSIGGPGDGLHPNRAGYQAMANSIDLESLVPNHTAKAPK